MYENRFEGMSIGSGKSFDFPLHSHYNLELCICTEGSIVAKCNGKTETLSKGDAMLAFSNDIHGYRKTEDGIQITVILSPRILPPIFTEIMADRYENFCLFKSDEAVKLAQTVKELSVSNADELTKIGYISILLGLVLRDLPKRMRSAQTKDDIFSKVVKYISEHYTEDMTLRSVASNFGIDYYNLSKMFTRNLSLTFTHYMHLLRVEEAKSLLKNTSKSMTEVCYECGFSDIRTFNRVFKSTVGCSPREYRVK